MLAGMNRSDGTDALDGHVALVTGGGSGIGAATCRRLAAEGARVAVLDRNADSAAATADACGGIALTCDVRDPDAVEAAVADAHERLGPLTDLIANAGVGRNKALHLYTDAEWAMLVGVNLTGTFHCIRSVVPRMLAAGGGNIVTVATLNATRPVHGEAPYSAAKAGVLNLTLTAALEYAPTIRANCVSPGLIDTPLTAMIMQNPDWRASAEAGTPLARAGTADEVAGMIAFLCSADAAYLTGQNFIVDGGASLPNLQADAMLKAVMRSFSDAAEP